MPLEACRVRIFEELSRGSRCIADFNAGDCFAASAWVRGPSMKV